MYISFNKPDISEQDIEAVSDVLRSGWITTGSVTKQFENNLAEYIGVPRVACVNSQTAGAEMILRLLGIGPGDEVILPAYTYTATCSVIYHVGAKPVMIDSQKDSPQMDYDQMEAAINENTKIIIPVDIGGVICDYDRIYQAIYRKQNLFKANIKNKYQKMFNRIIIVADTAHSLGAEINGKKSGNIADFSSFSFHAVKNLTTAEGGCITWKAKTELNNDDIYNQFMLLTLHGQTKDAYSKTKGASWEYDIVEPLYKYNMTDMAAALGNSQLKRYSQMLQRRHEIIKKYNDGFKNLPVSSLNHYPGNQFSSGHLYLLRIDNYNEIERNLFIAKMQEAGVVCNVHYKPLPMLTAYKNKGFSIENYKNAYNYYENLVTLPLYSLLKDDEVNYIIQSIKKIL